MSVEMRRETNRRDQRGPLNPDELNAFLARPLLARLACVDDEGWPYCVPLWFQWEQGRFWIIGSEHANWTHLVRTRPRVALLVDDPDTRTRVMCQGHVLSVDLDSASMSWIEIGRKMAMRYLADGVEGYESSVKHFSGRLFEITPHKLISWQGPSRQHR
jgi:hypothetical protein